MPAPVPAKDIAQGTTRIPAQVAGVSIPVRVIAVYAAVVVAAMSAGYVLAWAFLAYQSPAMVELLQQFRLCG